MSGNFPFGSPYALRINSLISALKELTTEVIVLCDHISSECNINESYGFYLYNDEKIYCLNQNYSGVEKITKLPKAYAEKLNLVIEIENPDIIISSSMYDRFSYIVKIADMRSIPIILESCEWYNPSTFKYGKLSHHYIMFSYCWKYKFPKVDGVITISRLLENHYKKYVNNVIRIPTILDVKLIDPKLDSSLNGKIRLLFAGTCARTKDSIKPYFEAFDLLGEKIEKLEVCICGVELPLLKDHLGFELYNRYKDNIICKGRVSQTTIAEEYKNSQFGIFMRPLQRSSNAGFSTKLGEGMSLGTPFIVNDTSDINLYIRNGENGFIVDSDPHKIAVVFNQIF